MTEDAESMDAIMVCVRVRPFNARETEMGCECIIEMPGGRHVVLENQSTHEKKTYEFDRSYWSHSTEYLGGAKSFTTQQSLYDDLGNVMLDCFFSGLNVTMF